jgi:hypothetical protein
MRLREGRPSRPVSWSSYRTSYSPIETVFKRPVAYHEFPGWQWSIEGWQSLGSLGGHKLLGGLEMDDTSSYW